VKFHHLIISSSLIATFEDHTHTPVQLIFSDKTLFGTKMKFDTFSIERMIHVWFNEE
jgi:hypothetical protein